jgi:hypothetical protein
MGIFLLAGMERPAQGLTLMKATCSNNLFWEFGGSPVGKIPASTSFPVSCGGAGFTASRSAKDKG